MRGDYKIGVMLRISSPRRARVVSGLLRTVAVRNVFTCEIQSHSLWAVAKAADSCARFYRIETYVAE
jgi:hypothetical protein